MAQVTFNEALNSSPVNNPIFTQVGPALFLVSEELGGR